MIRPAASRDAEDSSPPAPKAVALVAVPSAAQEAIYGSCGNSACDAFMRLSGVFTLLPVAALWSLKVPSSSPPSPSKPPSPLLSADLLLFACRGPRRTGA